MNVAAYVALALSSSVSINLLAYGLLIGPGLAFTAIVLPSTLVARWYRVNRGRAFGLVSMPIANAFLPLVAAATLHAYGLSATYGLLAALNALLFLPLLFVIDSPPDQVDVAGEVVVEPTNEPILGIGELMRRRSFWALSIGWAAGSMSVTVAAAHLVPMARGWGLDLTRAASLSTASFVGSIAGTLSFAWFAERIGGARAITLVCFNCAILWTAMVFQPPYMVLLLLAALLGFHGGATVPAFSMAVSQFFGRTSFGRVFGLGHLVGLPLNFFGVPAVAYLYVHTGSYTVAVLGVSAFLLAIAPFVATTHK
jgi:MFS family permease